jgi:hypothetical protein
MRNACPVSRETVDERAAQVCALTALLLLGVSLALASPWPALLLTADFGMRGFGGRRWSPLARLARSLATRLRLPPRPTSAAPKTFAARLGFGFSTVVAVAYFAGADTAGLAAGVPFGLCALMEGALGFCVGCRIYQMWQRLWPDAELSRDYRPASPP